jgi:putative FmdB family regulatory protein
VELADFPPGSCYRRSIMTERFECEDCGCQFEELRVEIEDEPLSCPACGGLDIQPLSERSPED